MPVRKFHSVRDMTPPPAAAPGDSRPWPRVAALLARSHRLFPRHLPPGIRKFRSVDDPARRVPVSAPAAGRKVR